MCKFGQNEALNPNTNKLQTDGGDDFGNGKEGIPVDLSHQHNFLRPRRKSRETNTNDMPAAISILLGNYQAPTDGKEKRKGREPGQVGWKIGWFLDDFTG
ncbi:hypothetical protein BPOR_0391g00110 [Botrytis porri]|uniref:Uncharacterized protein n=1 Tax=Botrytis porri TaxID=87229 RepID=A0A4Z1KSB1_9HELO|nr:hypothetical protein BPOR_0391g00110 [Botrytis porri]